MFAVDVYWNSGQFSSEPTFCQCAPIMSMQDVNAMVADFTRQAKRQRWIMASDSLNMN